jgi:hypothetical protein
VPEDPAPSDNPDPGISPRCGAVCLRLGERVDPDAADALWRLVLADPGGGPSAEGAGTRRAGRHLGQAEGIDEAGDDDLA